MRPRSLFALIALAVAVVAAAGSAVAWRSAPLRWWTLDRTLEARFPSVAWTDTEALAERLATAPPLLLDVRTPEEFAVSHLPGALRLDPDDAALALLADVPRDTPIVTYCSVGWRSARAAERLAEAGFTEVRNLRGSLFAWANEGRPVVRGDHPVRAVHPYDAKWGRLLRRDLHAYAP